MRKFAAVCLIVIMVFLMVLFSSPVRLATPRHPAPPITSAVPAVRSPDAVPTVDTPDKVYASLPLSFEENRGQTDSRVKFLSRGGGYTMFFTPDEVVLSLQRSVKTDAPVSKDPRVRRTQINHSGRLFEETVLRMTLDGAVPSTAVAVAGLEQAPGTSNYFKGQDLAKWLSDIPQFKRVHYSGVYPASTWFITATSSAWNTTLSSRRAPIPAASICTSPARTRFMWMPRANWCLA